MATVEQTPESHLERTIDWLTSKSDWANPILVKETRQALKSRQFVVTFMLLLAASWLFFVFGVMLGGSAIEFGAVGSQFFQFFYWILAVAVVVVVPFGAYRSLLAEKDQSTYDLLSITTITPRQIVWGKLLSALLQALIFYSAIAPFIAFTSLLQGFDFVQVSVTLVGTLLLSLLISMAAIAVSAVAKQSQWQAFTSMFVLGVLVWSLGLVAGLNALAEELNLAEPESWWIIGLTLLAAGSYFLLLQKVAQAQLTFESDDRTSGIRLVCSAQFFLLWLGLLALAAFASWAGGIDDDAVAVCFVVSIIHWSLVGLVAVTEDPFLSRRIRRNLPASKFRRLLLAPFLHGGGRGYLYVLGHLLVLGLVSTGCLLMFGADLELFNLILGSCLYAVIYLGLACALGRWTRGLSADIRPAHARVLTLILLAVGCLLPIIPWLWSSYGNSDETLLMITNPFLTVAHLMDGGHYSGLIWPMLIVAAVIAVFVNLKDMMRGIHEVVFADVRPRTLPPAALPTESAADLQTAATE